MEAEVLEQLVQRSRSPEAEVRHAALKEILGLPDEALLQLLSQYALPPRSHGRRVARRAMNVFPYGAFVLAIAIALSKDPSADPRLKWIVASLGAVFLVLTLGIMGYTVGSSYALPARRHAVGSNSRTADDLPLSMVLLLEGRTDRRFLPYLLTEIDTMFALFERTRVAAHQLPPALPMFRQLGVLSAADSTSPYSLPQTRRRYRKLLKGMLAQIGPEETIELSADQRLAFLVLLQIPEEDIDLSVGILARLEEWGDAQTVPALKRLIREDHWYVGSERVEAAARRCLESVERRIQKQRQGETLLRPIATTEAIPPETLLRPTATPPEQTPEQLLRPSRSVPPDDRA